MLTIGGVLFLPGTVIFELKVPSSCIIVKVCQEKILEFLLGKIFSSDRINIFGGEIIDVDFSIVEKRWEGGFIYFTPVFL
jgi:hypothetical protein